MRPISSIKQKFGDRLFVDFPNTKYSYLYNLQTFNRCASSAIINENNFTFAICTKYVNQQRITYEILA